MKTKTLTVSMLAILTIAAIVDAQDAGPKTVKYIIYPAKPETDFAELQRLSLGRSPQPRNHVVVNGSAALREDKTIDPKAIDLLGLRKALDEPARIKIGDEKWHISFAIIFCGRQPDEAAMQTLFWAMKGMARDLGYDEISVGSVSTSDEEVWWKRQVDGRKAYDQVGRGEVAETGVGDDFVAVYAVKTPYSRFRFEADCVINFKKPFVAGWDGKLSAAQEKTILQSAAKLKFKGMNRVLFRLVFDGVSVEAQRHFHEKTLVDLTKKMGFEKFATFTEF